MEYSALALTVYASPVPVKEHDGLAPVMYAAPALVD